MSTSTSAIKQNVKTTPKTREPSKERIKTKKDGAEGKTTTKKTVSKGKTGDAASPSGTRLKNGAPSSVSKLKKPVGAGTKKNEENAGVKQKTPAEDSSRKLKTTTAINKVPSSSRLKQQDSERGSGKVSSNIRPKDVNPSSSRLKAGAGKLKISSRRPGSPNGRIKKTQFIPNAREMYSNALKNRNAEDESISESSTLERPTTATLRRGSVVNANIAGPDVPKKKGGKSSKEEDATKKIESGVKTRSIEDEDPGKSTKEKNASKKIVNEVKTTQDIHQGKSTKEKKIESGVKTRSFGDEDIHPGKSTKKIENEVKTEDAGNKNLTTIKAGIDEFLRSETPDPDEEYDYEEDFDSYASDFDEYESSNSETASAHTINTSSSSGDSTSSSKPIDSAEEERKLDSGNFDLPEAKHKPILGDITEQKEQQQQHGSLSDEGFEEIKSSLQFVNFLGAKKRRELQRSQSRRNRRGEELLGMIRLDQRNFTLIDIPPVSYDTYIRSFGNRNSTQIASQTRDDDVDEEAQTETITKDNKWTQFPIKYPKGDSVSMNYKGVGSDDREDCVRTPKYDEYNLADFLRSSGQVVLALLEENLPKIRENPAQEIANSFCDGGVCLSADFLKPRSVSSLGFSTGGLLRLVSAHPPEGREIAKDSIFGDDFRLKTVGCVWDPDDLSIPEDVFAGFGIVNAVCFAATNNKLIFGGLNDGTVTLWDLLEGHRRTEEEGGNFLELDWRNSKKPVRMTNAAKCTTEPDLDAGSARIVAVRSVADNFGSSREEHDALATNLQVLALNEIGDLIVWGVIAHGTSNRGASLVRFSAFSLGAANPELTDLQCTDMCIDRTDPNHVYVATNYGYTLHCLVNGSKANPKRYSPESSCGANSIEACHHQRDCFLVSFEDGNVSLYSRSSGKPLATFGNRGEREAPVKTVQWSRNRPWIFYTTDSERTVHVWDLAHSEHFPERSIPFERGVRTIKLSEPTNINNKRSYMAIIAKDESVHLHQLTGDHARKSAEDYPKELKVFSNYIDRL